MACYVYEEPRVTKRVMFFSIIMISSICVMLVSVLLFSIFKTRLNELVSVTKEYEEQISLLQEQREKDLSKLALLNNYELQLNDNANIIENLTNINNELTVQSAELENTIKLFATSGKRPENYNVPEKISRGSYSIYRDKLKYVGEWEGTCYTPSPDECNNSKGITYSGKPVEPGRTIAVDPKYWELGTKFYIEGIGEVVATDIGSAVKGEKRFDWCLFDKTLAFTKGRFSAKVFLIED